MVVKIATQSRLRLYQLHLIVILYNIENHDAIAIVGATVI